MKGSSPLMVSLSNHERPGGARGPLILRQAQDEWEPPSTDPVLSRLDRDWRFDAMVFLVLVAALSILFAATPLDIVVANIFYSPKSPNPWPMGWHGLLSLPHRITPWITTTLALAGLAALAVGVLRRRDTWRRNAIFILLSVAIGPGLIVNSVFKEYWDRPRPRDVVEFGGRRQFTHAPFRGEGGKSFPCGDSSVGFLFAAGWWIWRRDRPNRATASLAAGIAAGATLGLGRMAAGGHFLSDVVWSAFMTLAVAHVLYHYVLRIPIPAHEAPLPRHPLQPRHFLSENFQQVAVDRAVDAPDNIV